jgi:hypothetical protein
MKGKPAPEKNQLKGRVIKQGDGVRGSYTPLKGELPPPPPPKKEKK